MRCVEDVAANEWYLAARKDCLAVSNSHSAREGGHLYESVHLGCAWPDECLSESPRSFYSSASCPRWVTGLTVPVAEVFW